MIVISLFFVITTKLFAQENVSEYKPFFNNIFSASLETANWDYKETDKNGDRFMRDYGRLSGLRLGIDTASTNNFYVGGHFSYLTGTTNYDGAIVYNDGHEEDHKSKSKNSILETEGRIGILSHLTESTAFTPYLGLSYWMLTNPNQADDPYDYSREISYSSIPIGIMAKTLFGTTSIFSLNASYYYFLGGKVKTHLSEIDPNSRDIINSQTEGSGMKLATSYNHSLGGTSLTTSLYWRTWKIARSDDQKFQSKDSDGSIVTYVGAEPANTTTMIGLSFGLAF